MKLPRPPASSPGSLKDAPDPPQWPRRFARPSGRRQVPWLLVGVAGSAVLLLLAAYLWHRRDRATPALSEADVRAYVEVAPAVRADRRAANLAGVPPGAWQRRPAIRQALDRVGWTMEDYVRVEGQVSAARLRLEDRATFDAEFVPADAPDAHLEAVRPHLQRVQEVQAPLAAAPTPPASP